MGRELGLRVLELLLFAAGLSAFWVLAASWCQ